MKILSIVSLKSGIAMEQVRPELASELAGSWQLYLAGDVREVYATESPTRVVFVLEASSVAEAKATLEKLPLVGKGLFELDLHELRPFANWALLPASRP